MELSFILSFLFVLIPAFLFYVFAFAVLVAYYKKRKALKKMFKSIKKGGE